jgi:hypothetical protein
MKTKSLFPVAAGVMLLFGVPGATSADIIYFFDNPSGFQNQLNAFGITDENILFNGAGLTSTGNPVQGQTGTGFVFDFSTVLETLTTPSSGQARIEAVDGSFDDLLIDAHLPNVFFRSISFNINPSIGPSDPDVDTTFVVVDQFGPNAPQIVPVGGLGLFFFGAIASNGQLIDTVAFSGIPAADVREVRVGDPILRVGDPIPEPASFLLVGSALALGIRQARRFRSRDAHSKKLDAS